MHTLPGRAFIPGVSPRDDRPAETTPHRAALPAVLGADETFRFAVDLYNHGFPWEAHEQWESLWLAAPGASRERHLLSGLIQAAAAAVKALDARWAGARKLAASAAEHLTQAGHCAGIDGAAIAGSLTAWAHHVDQGRPSPRIVLH